MDFVDLNNLGASLTARDRFDEAIKVFDLALKLKPDSHRAHINLSIAYERAGKLQEALDSAETGNDDTRAALKKFQDESDIKVTGTLNSVTLEKMGIPLNDKQKADAAAAVKAGN